MIPLLPHVCVLPHAHTLPVILAENISGPPFLVPASAVTS